MYSVSYLHEGATKSWYGVSPADADTFDRIFGDTFPRDMEKDPQVRPPPVRLQPATPLASRTAPPCTRWSSRSLRRRWLDTHGRCS